MFVERISHTTIFILVRHSTQTEKAKREKRNVFIILSPIMFLHKSASEFKGTMVLDDLTLMRQKIEAQSMMMILLLFLQKQNLAFAVYQFGSVLSHIASE